MSTRIMLVCTVFAAILAAPGHAQLKGPARSRAVTMYNQAVEFSNSGKVHEAKAVLERLVRKYPSYYSAHSFYWEILGKADDPEAVHAAVRDCVKTLEATEEQERDEDYFRVAINAWKRLEKPDRVDRVRREAVAKFPRGSLAQSARLDAARSTEDPKKAAALFQKYVDDFSENTSWVQLASSSLFRLIVDHPELFSLTRLQEAAEQYDKKTDDFIAIWDQPYKRAHTTIQIGLGLIPRDPALALRYLDRGLDYVELQTETKKISFQMVHQLLAVKVRAASELSRWKEVRAAADTILPTLDSGDVPSLPYGADLSESELRRSYAKALEHLGEMEKAREEWAAASYLDESLKPDFLKFTAKHPPDPARKKAIDELVASLEKSRTERRRLALAGTQVLRPAPKFALKDLQGKLHSLEDYLGKVVVLDFWATWCGPCIRELSELKKAHAKLKDDPSVVILAVSVDSEKDKVPLFARQKGYEFPVLLGDGTVNEPYSTQTIPQLYVIDGKGRIRFQQTGFEERHFLQRLDWMIEIASKPPPESVQD